MPPEVIYTSIFSFLEFIPNNILLHIFEIVKRWVIKLLKYIYHTGLAKQEYQNSTLNYLGFNWGQTKV